MAWLSTWRRSATRPSFIHVSTHQTHVGKALYEHAPDCATIAAVACMSSSLLKSSLGPNLLALIRVEDKTFNLFDKIFLEFNPHMQLTQKLVVDVDSAKSTGFIEKLKSNGPLFSSSLLQATIDSKCLPLLKDGFRSLRSLSLSNMERCEQLSVLKSLPSLSEVKLLDRHNFDAAFFKALGELENNRNLTSLDISGSWTESWCSEGFQNDFCGRLLSKNRLKKLELPLAFWDSMNEEDSEAFVNAGMTNLVDLRGVLAKLIRGEGFRNLRVLSVCCATDKDLVNVGNHCLFLEVLGTTRSTMTGSFLNDEKLVGDGFQQLRELQINAWTFSDSDVGTGFCRLLSLERLVSWSKSFDGSCLEHLPNPDRLRTIRVGSDKLPVCNLFRFINLEEVDLRRFQLSREDVLSFTRFKQLKLISLNLCGGDVASSEPFRNLCKSQLPNLVELCCYGDEESQWTEEDVEAILTECKSLRVLRFGLDRDEKMSYFEKTFPWVLIRGVLQQNATEFQKETTTEQGSGSRREREENI